LFRQLENVDKDLSAMIDDVNRFALSNSIPTSGAEDGNIGPAKDPVHQITAILNTHVTSLEWITDQTTKLREEVGKLEQVHDDATGANMGSSHTQGGLGASRADRLGTPSALGRSGLRRNVFLGSPRNP
jgi:hypothetical protein